MEKKIWFNIHLIDYEIFESEDLCKYVNSVVRL
jgi:hypothetical protein